MMKSTFSQKAVKLLLTSFLILLSSGLPVHAEDPPELAELKKILEETIPSVAYDECKSVLVPKYDVEVILFFRFLETTFQNSASNSSLSNIAIARYSEFKQSLEIIFASLSPVYASKEGVEQYGEQLIAYEQCHEITRSYIELAKQQMIMHIKNNSAQKKTYMLVEKYQAINEQLRNLNLKVAQMYAFFDAFKNKLPFFVEDCQ